MNLANNYVVKSLSGAPGAYGVHPARAHRALGATETITFSESEGSLVTPDKPLTVLGMPWWAAASAALTIWQLSLHYRGRR
jgi:hypothetical protein